jgi:hypothetical protein
MVGPVNTQVLASGQRRSLQAAPLGRSPRVPTLGVFPSSQPQTLGAHFNPSGLAPACIPAYALNDLIISFVRRWLCLGTRTYLRFL